MAANATLRVIPASGVTFMVASELVDGRDINNILAVLRPCAAQSPYPHLVTAYNPVGYAPKEVAVVE